MKLVIFRSVPSDNISDVSEEYLQEFDTLYSDRVIGHLQDKEGCCSVCVDDCHHCRALYDLDKSDDIVGVFDFPAVLPHVLESPAELVPVDIPEHDVLLVINIHEQVLIEALKVCDSWGTRGVVVPMEAPDWVSQACRKEAESICKAKGIEIAFPKPFCGFRPEEGTVLDQFRQHFKIGYPEVELTVVDNVITRADVKISAACGATYYIARWLEGRSLDDNIEIEVISKKLHSYPCTASMERDPELHDDTPMHVSGEAHYAILAPVRDNPIVEPAKVLSPTGHMVHKPIPAKENKDQIEAAKDLIIEKLKKGEDVSFDGLKGDGEFTPATISSAILLLKQEGKVVTDGKGSIRREGR
jgi:hypothetical protein